MKFYPTSGLLIVMVIICTPVVAQDDHDHHHEATNHCDTPTTQLNVTAGIGARITYDQDEYQVPKDTCILLTLINVDPHMAHDLEIQEVHGEGGIEFIHLHALSGMNASMHILTPDVDTEFDIYCTMKDHRYQGMEAVLVVGNGANKVPYPYLVLVGIVCVGLARRYNL